MPGPKQVPVLGNLLELTAAQPNVAEAFLKWTLAHGRVFSVHFGQFFGAVPRVVFLSDPALVKYVLQTGFSDGKYGRGPNFCRQYKVRGRGGSVVGRGIVVSWCHSCRFVPHRQHLPSRCVAHP